MKRQRGFTLLELMIVMAIIGILAGIALPAYAKYMNKARFQEVIRAAAAVKTAVEICFYEEGDLIMCDDGTSGRGSTTNHEVAIARDDAINGAHVKTMDMIYYRDNRVGIYITGATTVEGRTYELGAVPQDGGLVWSVNYGNSTCDEASLC